MREITFVEAIREALREEFRRDKTVFLMGETSQTYERQRLGLEEEFGEERVRYTPIAEAAIVGAAMGAALVGMRPVAEIISIDFTTCCMDQIVNQLAKYRYAGGLGDVKLPVVIRTQAGSEPPDHRHGPHIEQSLEAWFTHVPGLMVVMPCTPYDVKGMLKSCIRGNDPVLFIEHRELDMEKGPVPEEEYTVPIGKAEVKREGKDVTVVGWGLTVHQSLAAAGTLQKEGISVEVIDLRTLKPLDEETILKSVRKTGRLIVVHEACKTGGFGGEIIAIVAEKASQYLKAPLKRVASADVPVPFAATLLARAICNENDIVAAARDSMRSWVSSR
jgi:pyruvate/2-oxoglutarate/acetoin dehydrogenase E1 component